MRLHLELEDRVVSDESNRASIIDVPACAKLKPGVRFVHESPNPKHRDYQAADRVAH
jgi:hypothetical protein